MSSVVPQAVAVVRRGSVAGVSTTAASLAAVSCIAWTVYAHLSQLLIATVSSAIGVVLWTVIAAVSAVKNHELPSGWTFVWALAVGATLAYAGVTALGLLLVFEALTYTVPQAHRVRQRTEGVSLSTWLMTLTSASAWVAYSVGSGDPALGVANGMKALVSFYIVLALVRGRAAAADTDLESLRGQRAKIVGRGPP